METTNNEKNKLEKTDPNKEETSFFNPFYCSGFISSQTRNNDPLADLGNRYGDYYIEISAPFGGFDDQDEFLMEVISNKKEETSFTNSWGNRSSNLSDIISSQTRNNKPSADLRNFYGDYYGDFFDPFGVFSKPLEVISNKKEAPNCLNLSAVSGPKWDVSKGDVSRGAWPAIPSFDELISKNAVMVVVKEGKVAAPNVGFIENKGIEPDRTDRLYIRNWQRGDLLGRGSFGEVYQCYNENGCLFAAKVVSLHDQGTQGMECISQLQQEIYFLSQFQHDNIVRYLGTEKDDFNLYIFLELLPMGSLANLYRKFELMDSHVSIYTGQILSGLTYLHERKVVHRDIKCANILVDVNGSVKLADFGMAKETNLNDIKSCKGTPLWMAPEVLNNGENNGYGPAADIWSVGCTVLEMLTRQFPYSQPNERVKDPKSLIRSGVPPSIPETLSAEARDFISSCLQVNPDNRPTAAQLLKHSYVQTRSP